MSTPTSRQPKGIPAGGEFAATAHAEPSISLTDIEWAQQVTGTTAAEGTRYHEVMGKVFAAAKAPYQPEGITTPSLRVPDELTFSSPTPVVTSGRAGTITGRADEYGFYIFRPDSGGSPFQVMLHQIEIADPARRPTPEHYAAAFSNFATDYETMCRLRWNASAAGQADCAAETARVLVASLDASAEPLPAEVSAALADVRATLGEPTDWTEYEDPQVVADNVRTLRSGQKLVAALGFLPAPRD